MKIGIFDSGVGGLLIAKAIKEHLPYYDYVYLGDTKRVPYGNRSDSAVHQFTKEAINYLFKKERCVLVVVACNTASARALIKIQREAKNWPHARHSKVLGVLVPAAEEAAKYSRVGVLATVGTVTSRAFVHEIKKVNKNCRVLQCPAPILVPLAEAGEAELAKPFLKKYLAPLIKERAKAIVLGCTHYPVFKDEIRNIVSKGVEVLSQDEIIPEKLEKYLEDHPEIKKKITKGKKMEILLTDKTQNVEDLTREWFGQEMKIKLVNL